jgi:hypothetical protein
LGSINSSVRLSDFRHRNSEQVSDEIIKQGHLVRLLVRMSDSDNNRFVWSGKLECFADDRGMRTANQLLFVDDFAGER